MKFHIQFNKTWEFDHHLSSPVLWIAVSNIFLTSSLLLQLFTCRMLSQFSFTTTKLGIESIRYFSTKSGAWSASIFIKGMLCYAFSCSAKGVSSSDILSFLLIKSKTANPIPSSRTDWILSLDFAVVLMTLMENFDIIIIEFSR